MVCIVMCNALVASTGNVFGEITTVWKNVTYKLPSEIAPYVFSGTMTSVSHEHRHTSV